MTTVDDPCGFAVIEDGSAIACSSGAITSIAKAAETAIVFFMS
jgi:hypothetical protein